MDELIYKQALSVNLASGKTYIDDLDNPQIAAALPNAFVVEGGVLSVASGSTFNLTAGYGYLTNPTKYETLLNGAITDIQTTITVDSTTGFSSSGTIRIGSEDITYTAKTSTEFTGCVRGANLTPAIAHVDTVRVKQVYQIINKVSWNAFTGVTDTFAGIGRTYISISAAGAIMQAITYPTNTNLQTQIFVGFLTHNGGVIQSATTLPTIAPKNVGLVVKSLRTDNDNIALCNGAGTTFQGSRGIAIGYLAGSVSQGVDAVSIGSQAGYQYPGSFSVAVGSNAGATTQGSYSVCVGQGAGNNNPGQYAISIGNRAGEINQAASSIVINADASALNNTTAGSIKIRPVRSVAVDSNKQPLFYDTTTNEMSYDTASKITTLDSLTNVTVPSPNTGEILQYNGSAWVNTANTLDNLSNVVVPSPSTGQVLRYNGTNWTNSNVHIFLDNADGSSHVAINNAMAALPSTGGTIEFGPGTWVLTDGIKITKSITFIGQGRYETIIDTGLLGSPPEVTYMDIFEVSNSATSVFFEKLQIKKTDTTRWRASILYLSGLSTLQFSVKDCIINNSTFTLIFFGYGAYGSLSFQNTNFLGAATPIFLQNVTVADCRIEHCDFESQGSLVLGNATTDGAAGGQIVHIDGCRFINTYLLVYSSVTAFISQCVLYSLNLTNDTSTVGNLQTQNLYITGCNTAANAGIPALQVTAVAAKASLTVNLYTDGSNLRGSAINAYTMQASFTQTLTLNITSTDNLQDWNTPATVNNLGAGTLVLNAMIEYPQIDRDLTTVQALTVLPGTIVQTNNAGLVRWNGTAWIGTQHIYLNAANGNTHTAIQNAIAALPSTGGTIVLGSGTWTVTQGFTLSKSVIFQGQGKYDTVITCSAAASSQILFSVSGTTTSLGLHQLRVNCPFATTNWVECINFTNATGSATRQLNVTGCELNWGGTTNIQTGAGEFGTLNFQNVQFLGVAPPFKCETAKILDCRFEHCDFDTFANGMVIGDVAPVGGTQIIHFDGCRMTNTPAEIRNTVTVFFSQCVLYLLQCMNVGNGASPATQNIYITGCTNVAPAGFFNAVTTTGAQPLTTNLYTDGSGLRGGAANSYVLGSDWTLNVQSTDNTQDWNTPATKTSGVGTFTISGLIEYPKIDRTLTQVQALTVLPGTIVQTNNAGLVRRNAAGTAWVAQNTLSNSLTDVMISAPADNNTLMYMSGQWMNMAMYMPLGELFWADQANVSTTAIATTYTHINPPMNYNGNAGFQEDTTNGILKYVKSITQLFHVALSIDLAGVTNRTYWIAIQKNSTTPTDTDGSVYQLDPTPANSSLALHKVFQLAQNDTLRVVMKADSATTVTLKNVNLVAMGGVMVS